MALLAVTSTTSADPTLGFREEFPAASGIGSWIGGASFSNPGSGGLGGFADGYLRIARTIPDRLGGNSTAPEYAGDWTASGITQIRLWLSDVGADQGLEIHVSIGNQTNLWQYNPGFLPPGGSWGEYVVDLTNAGAFTQIIGAGTFADALHQADRLLVRHDLAPYFQSPDLLMGEFGLDHILLTNGVLGVGPSKNSREPIHLAPIFPNPAHDRLTLSIRSSSLERLRVLIVDAAGRCVRSAELDAGIGERKWTWDGRDDRGEHVAPGAYRARVSGESGGMSQPLVWIR